MSTRCGGSQECVDFFKDMKAMKESKYLFLYQLKET